MRTKEHSHEVYTRLAEHHIAKSKHHGGISKAHTAYAEAHKAMMDEQEKGSAAYDFHKSGHAFHLKKSEHHDGMAAEHADLAGFFVECAKDSHARKAMGMGPDRDEIVPDHIFGYLPEAPSNIRAVPRAGQRELGELENTVAPGLEKVLGFEE
jgi:hypothetical protein